MSQLSYGIERPCDLLSKLKWEGDKLNYPPNPYHVFNFILTAAALVNWIQSFYTDAQSLFAAPGKDRTGWILPDCASQWIDDFKCFPNSHNGVQRHIENVLSICVHTANASKHFHWDDKHSIGAVGKEPPIQDPYSYFFTSTEPDLFVTFRGENYGLSQIRGILLQFFEGLIEYFDLREEQAG